MRIESCHRVADGSCLLLLLLLITHGQGIIFYHFVSS
ncbi:hypothetical protein ERO13_D11G103166v2 [Gossypium hirsutum]|nr:hypothetical protein ERO13_D11G103166v2 [Gossypium hirsutum]